MRNNPNYVGIVMKYFNHVIGIYNTCGIYYRELYFFAFTPFTRFETIYHKWIAGEGALYVKMKGFTQ